MTPDRIVKATVDGHEFGAGLAVYVTRVARAPGSLAVIPPAFRSAGGSAIDRAELPDAEDVYVIFALDAQQEAAFTTGAFTAGGIVNRAVVTVTYDDGRVVADYPAQEDAAAVAAWLCSRDGGAS